jgi:hypothetical protein
VVDAKGNFFKFTLSPFELAPNNKKFTQILKFPQKVPYDEKGPFSFD